MVMNLSSLEIIAGLFAILVLVKLIVVMFNRQAWFNNVTKPIYGAGKITSFIMVVLAIIIFYFISLTLNIIQIVSVIAFTSLLVAAGLAMYPKEMVEFGRKITGKKLSFGLILYAAIWIIISILVLLSVFL